MISNFKEYLVKTHPINDKILDEYIALWTEVSIPKKTLLIRQGQIEKYLYFVIEGTQKGYCLHSGKQHNAFFTYKPSLCSAFDSFITQTPSLYYIETITNSTFLKISYDSHYKMIEKHRDIETLFRKITEQYFHGLSQQYLEIKTLDIESRFRAFTKRSPHLLRVLPQKEIASYLGISPTNFSKLINRIKI